jgi:hypothetical protein
VLTWRGVADVKAQFQVPTLLLDATLPDPAILQVSHPRVGTPSACAQKPPGNSKFSNLAIHPLVINRAVSKAARRLSDDAGDPDSKEPTACKLVRGIKLGAGEA